MHLPTVHFDLRYQFPFLFYICGCAMYTIFSSIHVDNTAVYLILTMCMKKKKGFSPPLLCHSSLWFPYIDCDMCITFLSMVFLRPYSFWRCVYAPKITSRAVAWGNFLLFFSFPLFLTCFSLFLFFPL